MRWTLSGVTLSGTGGLGTASGSFIYDADTDSYSNIDITTTGFTFTLNSTPVAVPSQHYTTWSQGNGSYLKAVNSNTATFILVFTQTLTSAGGVVGIAPQLQVGPASFIFPLESIPTSQWAPNGAGPLAMRGITQGSLTGAVLAPTSVPALSATGLLILGILLASCAATLVRTGTRSSAA